MSGYPWVCIRVVPKFKPGDPRPDGYVEFFEWAKVQHRAGLRQARCQSCGKVRFPQETCCAEPRP